MNRACRIIILAAALFLALFAFSACEKTYHGTTELMEKVRDEIPIADVDTINIQYAGTVGKGDTALFWYITGDENQMRRYFAVECKIRQGTAEYKFVHLCESMDRCMDVGVLQWKNGYAFCINNPNCKAVRITDNAGIRDEIIEKDSYPYVFFTPIIPSAYVFLNAGGNELR